MRINYTKRISIGLGLILMLWCSGAAFSQVKMVKDINKTSGDGSPNSFFALGNHLFFVADDHIRKKELWVTDGTTVGTQFFKNIGALNFSSRPRLFTKVGDKAFFVAGSSLWMTDGTREGTTLVREVRPSANNDEPRYLIELGGKLYFRMIDGQEGGLWVSDGTKEGTKLVKAVVVGFNNLPNQMVKLGDKIYFAGFVNETGVELWESDGTEAGTKIVKDISPGAASTLIYDLEVEGNKMYFSSRDELWESDGTEAGTRLVVDLNDSSLGLTGDNLCNFTKLGTKMLFSGADKLWVSNLTATGTTKLHEYKGSLPRKIDTIVVLGNQAFFAINDAAKGKELWVTDGTVTGTKMLKDINPGAPASNPSSMFVFNNKLYFAATTASNGNEWWQSDGTEAGTFMLKDIYNGAESSTPTQFFVWNNKIYFQAKDAQHGEEVWVSDGTTAGTNLLKDVYSNTVDGYSGISFFYNNQFLFVANGGTGGDLWTLNGADESVTKITNLGSRQENWLGTPIEFNGKLYFMASDTTHGRELWVSDGTDAGTKLLKDLSPGKEDGEPNNFLIFENKLYFWGIWSTDGTEAGTKVVRYFRPRVSRGVNTRFTVFGNKFYFAAADGVTGPNRQLWMSDGTGAGTVLVKTSTSALINNPTDMTVFNNQLYFYGHSSNSSSRRQDLWTSDGTEAGTSVLVPLSAAAVGDPTTDSKAFVEFNGKLLFWGGNDLWETDGTSNGTKQIKDLGGGGASSEKYIWQGKIYFEIRNNLWVTDGTEAGTNSLTESMNANIKEFVEYDNKLYFSAINLEQGQELWYTDGTSAGTQFAVDIFPGHNSSKLSSMKVLNNKLFFSANSGNGTELHVYQPLPKVTGVLSFSPKQGKPGDEVTITGMTFDAVIINQVVRFNQANATVVAATTTELKVTVPESATTGKITVQNNQQIATSADDFLISLTSLPQTLQEATLTLYPNPVAHTLRLKLEGKAANRVSLTA